MNPAEAAPLLAAAEAAADVAGAVLRPFFRQRLAVAAKTDASPVTIADRSAEQAMRAVLGERYPGHGIWGEEFGRTDPGARFTWVLDPIDGTRAFITGRPLWGTLIALLDEGRPVLGVIDQPVTGERWLGCAGMATRFHGSLGGATGCRPCASLADAELAATSPAMFDIGESAKFARLASAVRRTSWGGDCYAYGLLALGLLDVIAEADLKPWDWLALVPVVEGAGGRMADWEGRPLDAESGGQLLAVGDPALLAPALVHLAGS